MTNITFPHSDSDWLLNKHNVKLAIDCILKAIKVDKTYDIPYLAGYSLDGKTIYIDKDLGEMESIGKNINIDRFFVLHEVVEKALLMWLQHFELDISGRYMIAHQIACNAEAEAVKESGLDIVEYNKFCNRQIDIAGKKKLNRIPKDLDLQPYKDEEDYETIKRMIKALQ